MATNAEAQIELEDLIRLHDELTRLRYVIMNVQVSMSLHLDVSATHFSIKSLQTKIKRRIKKLRDEMKISCEKEPSDDT